MRVFSHLSFTDRLKIERMANEKRPAKEIAKAVHVHISTIYRELARGRYEHLNSDYTTEERYSPDIAEQRYRANLSAKGADIKIGRDHKLASYIENKIAKEGYSPAAVVGEIRTKNIPFETSVCKTTVYSYISKGVFLHLTNKDLPRQGKKKNQYRQVRAARPPRGESIENRPAEINERRTFGHWEMDTVVGKKGGGKRVSLMLTERKTLFEIIIPIRDKSDESVVAALNRLEKRFGKLFPLVFRSITVDNGSEFANCRGMEKSKYRKGDRTKMYYCHPYSSYERGSNENQNGMFRRKVPKGTDLSRLPLSVFQDVEDWMNNYPRGIHGFRSARELFEECLQEIASK